MKNKIVIISTYLFAALLYIVGPYSFFKACKIEEKPMKCHWSAQTEIGIAIILIGIAVAYVLTKTAREKSLLSVVAIVNAIVAILIPRVLIGGCTMETMPCRSITFPALYVISIVLILVSAANIVVLLKNKKEFINA